MKDCIFCKIVRGEIPCYKIYEDENVLAFLDIENDVYGHTLVVPKKHCTNILDAEDETLAQVMKAVQKIAKHFVDDCGFDGVHTFNNNGEVAGQSVMHLHFHIKPRKTNDGIKSEFSNPKVEASLEEICEKLGIKEEKRECQGECDKQTVGNVVLYTDGACSGNPGLGGWAAIMQSGGKTKKLSGGEENTTNNRMELMGVISGLEAIKKPCKVDIYSDSAYVVNAFLQNWIEGWLAKGWKGSTGKDVLNIELWKRLLQAMKPHKVEWHKVKGHADNELNNECDALARAEIDKLRL